MGGGLAFLTKKSFNPANWSNQRQVWEAKQNAASEQRRVAEREAQLKREREEEDLARAIGGNSEGGRKQLAFMYEAGKISGLDRKPADEADDDLATATKPQGKTGNDSNCNIFERQPGDDDAAAAFRLMLAKGATAATEEDANQTSVSSMKTEQTEAQKQEGEEQLPWEKDGRTALEKEVGRSFRSSGLTLKQQFERFPELKHAPKALKQGEQQDAADVVGLNFKPLGAQIRNVQCLACGKWGHSKGDRECELVWDPFSSTMTAGACVAVQAKKMVTTQPTEQQGVRARDESREVEQKSDRKRKKESKRRRKDERRKKRHKKKRTRRDSYSSGSDDDSAVERNKQRRRRYRSRSRSHS